MELVKLTEKTFYIKNPVNIGVYKTGEKSVWLIDSGADKDTGKKILKLLEQEGLFVEGIISTHSHADHIGGNAYIKEKTGCRILANKAEKAFTEHTFFEPAFLWGGFPPDELRNKFLLASPTLPEEVNGNLPKGLQAVSLPGHCFDMIGIKTDDGVFFIGDSVFSHKTAEKYHLCYLYDIKAALETLEMLKQAEAKYFVPSHSDLSEDISDLLNFNAEKVLSICNDIVEICADGKIFEDILKEVFDKYSLVLNSTQYVLIGSTLKSYISYLKHQNKLEYFIKDNKMLWKAI